MHESLTFRTIGEGPLLLLIHGAAEDAAMLGPQARAFAERGRRVAWYDRRGTGSTARTGWPEGGVDLHADDAATVVRELGGAAQVLGFSSGGVVAMALAARHPELDLDVIAWEPAAITALEGGLDIHDSIMKPVDLYLDQNPGDWTGAYAIMLDLVSGGQADMSSPGVAAQLVNAEPAVRDDARVITRHEFPPGSIPPNRVRLAHGRAASDIHAGVMARLVSAHGLTTVVVDAALDHEVYLKTPDVLARMDLSR